MKLAVDSVVFTVVKGSLKILLIKRKNPPFKGSFALPGGFVEENEGLEIAVKRELMEETNVKNIFLKQIGAYGKPGRDPRGRVISVAYLALISPDHILRATSDAAKALWHPAGDLPRLAFDHSTIISDALERLKFEVQTTNIAVQILPERFTLTELQHLYESILGKELDKRNFRKRIKELGILKETKETAMEGAHRPAMLYKFRDTGHSTLREKIHIFV